MSEPFYERLYKTKDYLVSQGKNEMAETIDDTFKKLLSLDSLNSFSTMEDSLKKRTKKIMQKDISPEIKLMLIEENQFALSIVSQRTNYINSQKKKQENATKQFLERKKKEAQAKKAREHIKKLSQAAEKKEKYNKNCRNLSGSINSKGNIYDCYCEVGMDITYCGDRCPYATNIKAGRSIAY